jgi:hypothetical protein
VQRSPLCGGEFSRPPVDLLADGGCVGVAAGVVTLEDGLGLGGSW